MANLEKSTLSSASVSIMGIVKFGRRISIPVWAQGNGSLPGNAPFLRTSSTNDNFQKLKRIVVSAGQCFKKLVS